MTKNQHFEIFVQTHFSAAHHLRGYSGKCEKPHGHNWTIIVYVKCAKLNEIGIGIDFCDVKSAIKDTFEKLDHTDLNTLPQFRDENPSSENIAKYLYRELSCRLNNQEIHVTRVCVSETSTCGVSYWEE